MVAKILVALDNSPISNKIFQEALTLARSKSAQLMLVHILSTQSTDSPPDPRMSSLGIDAQLSLDWVKSYRQQWESFEQESLEILKSFEAEATAAGVATELTQTYGNPGRTLCELASSWNADLVVLGRRGKSQIAELFLGSTSNYAIHHLPCSVYVVHG
ncbi:universal stress protein [Roseofilum casamattae]|uniref:Universal stress protein n=1 Tax=Roseofilum casamattae BLCC-M143 TaxID=3022442 RepID=A0ABT7BZP7_9CYAN|nr:universal stress protein [Roseofilum casamattae]MDJ1183743.1 universal stress protein [Roseofilum casamattae BLCC-M143]